MDFKKLAEVELLDSAPKGATAFAEVNGEVKRVAGGVGGGKGYIWDVTDRLMAIINGEDTDGSVDDDNMTVTFLMTREEAMEVIEKAIESKGIIAYFDLSPFDFDGDVYVSGTDFGWLATPSTIGDMVFVSGDAGATPLVKILITISGDVVTAMINIQLAMLLVDVVG